MTYNQDLDRRIATEFMGYPPHLKQNTSGGYTYNSITANFSPTTDMNAAYIVLEKIVSKLVLEINVNMHDLDYVGYTIWVHHIELDRTILAESLPLAISLLTEQIMDSTEHMALFKGK